MGTWIIWLSTSSSGCPPQKSGSLSRSQYLQADRTHSQLRTEGCTHQRHWCLASSSRSQYLQADSTRPQLRVEGCTHQRHTCLASWAAYSTCKQTAATLSSGWKAVHTRGTRAWLSGPLTVPASGQPPLSAGHRWMVQGERLHTSGTGCLEPLALPAEPNRDVRSRQGTAHNTCPSQQGWSCSAPTCQKDL